MLGRCAGQPARASIATRCPHELCPRRQKPRGSPIALRALLACSVGGYRSNGRANQRRARVADVGADDRDDLAGRRQHRGQRATSTGGPQTPQDELLRRFFDFEGPPGREREVEGAGSGVIVDAANGYILTNHHVVANADKITVTLLENRSLTARDRRLGRRLRPRGAASRSDELDAASRSAIRRSCASATTSSRSAIRSASRTR